MKLTDVKSIGVVGAGVMGGGISQSLIVSGYNVVCRDLNDEILAKTKDTIINGRFGLKGGVERGKLTNGDHFWIKRRDGLGVPVEFEVWDGGNTRAVARKDKVWVPSHFPRRLPDGRHDAENGD